MSYRVAIASDHAGFYLKQAIIEHFVNSSDNKVIFENLGTDNANESVDYPDYANKLCYELLGQSKNNKSYDFGILICGSGIGISIAANRHKNIRAALVYNKEVARLAKEHNKANVLCFGARFLSIDEVILCINEYISAKFDSTGRHQKRIDKLS